MEEIWKPKEKAIFKKLKTAIGNFEYRDIVYHYNETITHKNAKCIKLVFMDNNWYLVLIDDAKHLLFRRLSFIKEVKYASKTAFHQKDIKPYLDFLKTVQNAMTLYGVTPKIATIRATPMVAKYFEKDMKKFLPSQKFKKKLADGSVLFTLKYTQELEILPFVQKWLPDLVIIEPLELREAYAKKLKSALGHYE